MTSTIVPPRGSTAAVGTTTPSSRANTGTGIVAIDVTQLRVADVPWPEEDLKGIRGHVLRMLSLSTMQVDMFSDCLHHLCRCEARPSEPARFHKSDSRSRGWSSRWNWQMLSTLERFRSRTVFLSTLKTSVAISECMEFMKPHLQDGKGRVEL